MDTKLRTTTSEVRRRAREAAVGKGRPGQFNPNRAVRFATPTDKQAARGRTYRGDHS